ncbi:MAG: 7-carboxy-7-deazaguanine synthase QueE [Candidatus Margulisiibacteriota bacterium]
MPKIKANIQEIFPSLQGEGLFAGQPQIFLRFSGCNLACSYCDTDISPTEKCRVHQDAFGQKYAELLNPLSVPDTARIIGEYAWFSNTVALTGGEPLLQVEFLRELLPVLKKKNKQILLETNGTLAEQYNILAPWLDIVSMDIKLPDAGGQPEPWPVHKHFLAQISKKTRCYIKVIIDEQVTANDLKQIAELLTGRKPLILFLQPEAKKLQAGKLRLKELVQVQTKLKRLLPGHDIRIMPQLHKLWGIL